MAKKLGKSKLVFYHNDQIRQRVHGVLTGKFAKRHKADHDLGWQVPARSNGVETALNNRAGESSTRQSQLLIRRALGNLRLDRFAHRVVKLASNSGTFAIGVRGSLAFQNFRDGARPAIQVPLP